MTINGLEAAADAIMQFEGYFHVDRNGPSVAYRNRNPGNLETNGQKNAYSDFATGYSALLRELHDKFTGNNRHGIGPESTLLDLFNVYAPPSDRNPTNAYCGFVAHWITIVTGRTVTPQTRLKDIWQAAVDMTEVTT